MDPTLMPEPGDSDLNLSSMIQDKPYRVQARVAWILMAVVAVIALIPILGFASWFIVGPMMLVAFIMTVMVFSKGGVGHGLALLSCQLIVMPIVVILGPFISSALGFAGTAVGVGVALDESKRPMTGPSTLPYPAPASSAPIESPPSIPKLPMELESLKTKMLEHQSMVLSWLNSGSATETPTGFLKPGDSLDIENRKILQQQNLWREQAFARIGEITGTTPEEVAKSYARLVMHR
ncbi:MAG: hypothetical protein ABI600_10030 [Luteolibacter sp.]